MDIVTESLEREWYRSRSFVDYFGGLQPLVFDIETTGLSPFSSQFVLGGTLRPMGSNLLVSQWFAESPAEEPDLLLQYRDVLQSSDVVISYNGNGFDLPFLKQRLSFYGFPFDFSGIQSLDLYRVVQYYSKLRDTLPNLKQKTIETFLGSSEERRDEISGQESVQLYNKYLRDRAPEDKQKILLHNRDDLVQLASILRILDKLDLHRILFYEGFSVVHNKGRAFVRQISFGKSSLAVRAITTGLSMDYYSFATGYQATHDVSQRILSLSIPFLRHGDSLYVNALDLFQDPGVLSASPHYVDGYLLLRTGSEVHHREINQVIRMLLLEVLHYFYPLLEDSPGI
ncbi:MAG: hypothetical protein CVU86_08950 [Firmicutes bacterium HGW-Firmicutes-11]|jgi:hypothetical protein|nr:MAG: hypothetical protein CVU86_08950 [Firmicutes bacterium HGW-Firmicutes-11]